MTTYRPPDSNADEDVEARHHSSWSGTSARCGLAPGTPPGSGGMCSPMIDIGAVRIG